MNLEFTTDLEEIRRVSSERQYWFTCTYSGVTFDDFYEREYIGIGLNKVPYKLINEVSGEKEKEALTELKIYIENNTDYKGGEVTKWANQLVAFEHEMNIGDYVIIPSQSSFRLAIDEITSNVYVEDDNRGF